MKKTIYLVRTAQGKWGKALNLEEALKNAYCEKDQVAYTTLFIYNEGISDQDLADQLACWVVNDLGNIVFADDATGEEIATKNAQCLADIFLPPMRVDLHK